MTTLSRDPPERIPVTFSPGGDTVRMPWSGEGGMPDLVVPPALAVLFRMAVGPSADFYVPRFLHRESRLRSAPGWVWPAFFAPAGWAFYRKLWWIGVLFALLPFAGLGVFLTGSEALGGGDAVWWSALAFAVVVVPGVAAALLATAALHRQVRDRVRQAEAVSERPDRIAAWLAERQPTSWSYGVLLGFAAAALWLAVALPALQERRDDRAVRGWVAASLGVVAPLQQAVEGSHERSVSLRVLLQEIALDAEVLGASGLEAVAVDPANGRLRLTFAAAVPLLAGKSLVLAPVIDAQQQLRWLCVPIDIPVRWLPSECRRR